MTKKLSSEESDLRRKVSVKLCPQLPLRDHLCCHTVSILYHVGFNIVYSSNYSCPEALQTAFESHEEIFKSPFVNYNTEIDNIFLLGKGEIYQNPDDALNEK